MNINDERKCAFLSLTQVVGLLMEDDYAKALTYMEHARRSIYALHTEQKEQEQINEAVNILKDINPNLDAESIVQQYRDSHYV